MDQLIPLSDEARVLLALRAQLGAPPIDELTPQQARAAIAEAGAFPPVPVGAMDDVAIAGPGGPLALRIYRPPAPAAASLPALLFFHGGGFVLGNLDSHDRLCRRFCVELGFPVVAVDYRLAPEHPFPAAVEDAYAAARWLFDHAVRLSIDPARIAVGGDSAGGNLAAVCALASARGDLPAFARQLLCYPVTDLSAESEGYARVADGVPISGRTMRWFRNHYLVDLADGADWRASPLRAASLAGAPPAFVMTARHDPLAEEGAAYARRLAEAGVEVTHVHYAHHLHAFLGLDGGEAASAISGAAASLRVQLMPFDLRTTSVAPALDPHCW